MTIQRWLRRLRRAWRHSGRLRVKSVLVILLPALVAAMLYSYALLRRPSPIEISSAARPVGTPASYSLTIPAWDLSAADAARDAGEYERALRLVAAAPPGGDSTLSDFRHELTTPLSVDFRMHYRSGEFSRPAVRQSEIRLTPADEYYLTAHVSDRCFLYLFLVSGDVVSLLFPSPLSRDTNAVSTGTYRIPSGTVWLQPTGDRDQIILLAARWRLVAIEKLVNQQPQWDHAASGRLLRRLDSEENLTLSVPGLVFGRQMISLPRTAEE